MAWLETGFVIGQILFFILLIGMFFSRHIKEMLFEDMFDGTMFGEIGRYLFLPDTVEGDLPDVGPFMLYFGGTLVFSFLLALMWVAWTIIFTLVGALIIPAVVVSLLLSPFLILIYYRNKDKFTKK